MIYTEKDLKQAYTMGYNEAVDDVNAYIDQESMEFSLDESYDEDYSAVEAAIMNETKSVNKEKHDKIIKKIADGDGKHHWVAGIADLNRKMHKVENGMRKDDGLKTSEPHYHLKY